MALENAYADPVDGVSVRGIVRVLNLDYHKAVYIRWTLNEWRSMVDYRATYLKGSNDGATDIFTFKIYAPLDLGQSLVFAVRYTGGFLSHMRTHCTCTVCVRQRKGKASLPWPH